jgi:hypothetical protein
VPLDLSPSSILESVTVQKSYSVDFPGEFGGGVIDLRTVDAPNDPFFSMSASIGGNTETTGDESLIYFGSRTDFTGFDDGTRDVPGPLLAFGQGVPVNMPTSRRSNCSVSVSRCQLAAAPATRNHAGGFGFISRAAQRKSSMGTFGLMRRGLQQQLVDP